MSAAQIVDFHEALKNATNAQILWWPDISEIKYQCNISFNNSTNVLVKAVCEGYVNQDLIQLTLHNNMLYYTWE